MFAQINRGVSEVMVMGEEEDNGRLLIARCHFPNT